MNRYLGIELGSTRIKAVVIDENYVPVSKGDYSWKSTYENGVWTYDLSEAVWGIKQALLQVEDRENISAVGISGMMHGYLAFDKDWNLLTPFRTWQNTMTAQAANTLTNLFGFNIPQRWSIAHLFQAVLNREPHVERIAHITTLAGYIHYLLTGVNAVGIGEASGIFPIDSKKLDYDEAMLSKFASLEIIRELPWRITDILPQVLPAGADGGCLTSDGAALMDQMLTPGIPFAPPEGDAGTGMVATNAVKPRTGNISAGTSIFFMVVLEKPLANVYEQIDVVTTPAGKPVAMVHCNNCTTDMNAWISVFKEAAVLFGADPENTDWYTKLHKETLKADLDCGGILTCNYLAGEGVTGFDAGRPMVMRTPGSNFTLANLFRSMLYSSMATLRLGMDILAQERVAIDCLIGHGGLFKTEDVAQRYMAAACSAPIACMQTAAEGGPYGMALLAAYRMEKQQDEPLEFYLSNRVFALANATVCQPDSGVQAGFNHYLKGFCELLKVERKAIDVL